MLYEPLGDFARSEVGHEGRGVGGEGPFAQDVAWPTIHADVPPVHCLPRVDSGGEQRCQPRALHEEPSMLSNRAALSALVALCAKAPARRCRSLSTAARY